jgi:thiol-disulfide isomerase/thioredoxin
MIRRSRACLLILMLMATSVARGQAHEPNPEAVKAFEELLNSYRQRPALAVKEKIEVGVNQEGAESRGGEKTCDILIVPGAGGRVVLNGFTCHLHDGMVYATHESTDHSYFSVPDDESPYYALLNLFRDMPFMMLAIGFGEPAAEDVVMQLHQMTPWIQPTKVGTEIVDGKSLQHIALTSDNATVDLYVDPETKLMTAATAKISSGELVQGGATMQYKHTFEYTPMDKAPDEKEWKFDPGRRQKNDVLAALVDRPPAAAGGGMPGGAPAGALVGKPAPDLVLTTMDAKAVDLEELRGQVVVLDFWATWCGPCRAALPMLHDVASWAADQDLPVKVYTVNTFEREEDPDQRLASVKEFWEKQKHALPVLMDYSNQTAQAWGVQGIPATFIVRSDGTVHAQHSGAGPDYAEQLKAEITEALESLEAPAEPQPIEE